MRAGRNPAARPYDRAVYKTGPHTRRRQGPRAISRRRGGSPIQHRARRQQRRNLKKTPRTQQRSGGSGEARASDDQARPDGCRPTRRPGGESALLGLEETRAGSIPVRERPRRPFITRCSEQAACPSPVACQLRCGQYRGHPLCKSSGQIQRVATAELAGRCPPKVWVLNHRVEGSEPGRALRRGAIRSVKEPRRRLPYTRCEKPHATQPEPRSSTCTRALVSLDRVASNEG